MRGKEQNTNEKETLRAEIKKLLKRKRKVKINILSAHRI